MRVFIKEIKSAHIFEWLLIFIQFVSSSKYSEEPTTGYCILCPSRLPKITPIDLSFQVFQSNSLNFLFPQYGPFNLTLHKYYVKNTNYEALHYLVISSASLLHPF